MDEDGSKDWSNLPPEMLRLITKELDDISDFIRFRAVCPTWRSSTSVSDAPPQFPWFLEDRYSPHLYSNLYFYSLSSDKVYCIECSNSSNCWLKGLGHDYVFSCNWQNNAFSLLNPLTNNQVHLPSLDISLCPFLVKIEHDPIQIVKNLVISGKDVAFYQPIEKKWSVIEIESETHGHDTYYNGMYYINETYTRITKVVDVNTNSLICTVPPPPNSDYDGFRLYDQHKGRSYLIESSGEILRVYQHDDQFSSLTDCRFFIHRLDLGSENTKPCWIKIDGIGDRILFLDSYNGFSLCSNDLKGFKGDSIYFLKSEQKRYWDDYPPPIYHLCRYDIKEDRAQVLHCHFDKGGSWIVPSLR